ncbi:virion structural protein [Pseudomonas phage Phabio]|uniref:Virion structural protein n=1 Tax=Pseudomonas phage Phabio TaxID=2006668 RepID=A0A1Y0SZ31_9CAUD|nr:internal head protein [Pseudomonas phage Phabio]ARV76769.1 virion structural protein [Pseudomonas phage Phabio]
MVSENNQLPPENIDGVTPVDFPVITEKTLEDMDLHETRLEALGLEMDKLSQLATFLETNPSTEMLSYALEKYDLDGVVSNEDINKSAQQVWDRTKLNLRRYQSDLFSYAKIIQSGSERAVERLEMLLEMSGKLQNKPYKETVVVNKNRKYGIDGKFEPTDIRPLMDQTQNLFDFYDKVLINYMRDVDKVILKVEVDHTWTDDTIMKFEKFDAKKWMSNFTEVEEDERFRVSSNLVRSVIAQGNKALYYSGPTDAKTETIKDWAFMVNTIRRLKLKYYSVPGMKPTNEEENTVTVGNPMSIKQRITYLLGVAKRISNRQGYDKKISAELRKLETDCERLRNRVRGLRQQISKKVGEEEKDEGRPVVSDIVKDLVLIMNSLTRLVTDYNNGLAAQLRLVGALGYVADLELKAYEAPMKKPTQEIVEKTET